MKKNKDNLGDRMKEYYENRTQYYLPRRTYIIIRIDGKAFHTYTLGMEKPFDDALISDMNQTAVFLCENIQGAKLAFVQSDEISILVTDFDTIKTCAWFDNNLQKMSSVSASFATAKFNQLRTIRASKNDLIRDHGLSFDEWFPQDLAFFDSRVYAIPSRVEVENYFIWRQQDATVNSISSVAQSLYPKHKDLEFKSTNEMQEMMFQKGVNWNDFSPRKKRGGLIMKTLYERKGITRHKWKCVDPPIFTEDRSVLDELIPYHE